jgi:hypothetical protein
MSRLVQRDKRSVGHTDVDANGRQSSPHAPRKIWSDQLTREAAGGTLGCSATAEADAADAGYGPNKRIGGSKHQEAVFGKTMLGDVHAKCRNAEDQMPWHWNLSVLSQTRERLE